MHGVSRGREVWTLHEYLLAITGQSCSWFSCPQCVSPPVGMRGMSLSLTQGPLPNVITPECCNAILQMETNQQRSIDLVIWVSDIQNPVASQGLCVCVCCGGVFLEKLGSHFTAAQTPRHSLDPTQPNSSSETASCMKERNSSGAFQILEMA